MFVHILHFIIAHPSYVLQSFTCCVLGLFVTLKMLNPMVRFSPWPTLLRIFRSFCCSEISTSSVSFVMSNRYCNHVLECSEQTSSFGGLEGEGEGEGEGEEGAYLRVLQERLPVVCTAAAAVQQGLRVFGPAAKVHDLVPGLVDADHGRVDEATDVRFREELAPVRERHPREDETTFSFYNALKS